ncbi:MAG TPA: protein kinase [Chthoniobacterales bacterium]|nr:protein kinase [Chthoniobacterales bacterium]
MTLESRKGNITVSRNRIPLTDPAPQQALGDRYTLELEIGRGGMATVYRAHDPRHGRSVAVKVLDREVAAALGTERFLQEIKTVASLTHPHIVPVHDSGETNGVLFYVMPHIEGETLRDRITREKRVPAAEAVKWTRQLAAALDFAHRHGVVHRDIKPENVILFEGEPLILDFGIAKAISAAGGETLTRTGIAIGTPAYLSPEQASGETQLDGRSDLYSLACVVYEMLSGAPPFIASTPQGVIAKRFRERPAPLPASANVSAAASDVILRALSLDPADRYLTVSEFAHALANEIPSNVAAESGRRSIAVLPFTNMSADAENEFFTDGISEEIINALTKVRALDVASRTSAFAFKGNKEDITAIGRKLKVHTVLEGSVRKAGNRLRISTQLIDVATSFQLWSERYDREMEDVFAIQDEIATSIVNALKVVLTEKEEAAIKKIPTQSVRAYEYYLRGRQLFHQRRPETLDAAEDLYRRAIALDPDYALAFAGLADCSCFRFFEHAGGDEALAQAESASRRALKLDPELAEAHASRGLALTYQRRFDEASEEFERAMELDSVLYEAPWYYGRSLQAQGKLDEAVKLYEKAAQLRVDDYQALMFAAIAYESLGRNDEARAAALLGIAAAERALALNPAESRALSLGAARLHMTGETVRGEEWARRAVQSDPTNPLMLYNIGCFFARVGNSGLALDHLERALELGMRNRDWLMTDPDLDSVRDDPRFAALLTEVPPAG